MNDTTCKQTNIHTINGQFGGKKGQNIFTFDDLERNKNKLSLFLFYVRSIVTIIYHLILILGHQNEANDWSYSIFIITCSCQLYINDSNGHLFESDSWFAIHFSLPRISSPECIANADRPLTMNGRMFWWNNSSE